jgi:hypothetical protein
VPFEVLVVTEPDGMPLVQANSGSQVLLTTSPEISWQSYGLIRKIHNGGGGVPAGDG